MSKWLNLFLENEIVNRSDKSDRFDLRVSLSGDPQELLDEKKVENNHSKGGDKSARFRFETNMSPLSLRPRGLLDEKVVNTPEPGFDSKVNMSVLSVPPEGPFSKSSLLDDFEERLAITEYDGHQTSTQAHRIAYQDAFIEVLNTLPYEEAQGYYDEDWLTRRIKAAQDWLVSQGLKQPR
ncbi:MAG TPA: hypothetical protein VMW10_07010 [Alphaproteobacteria bacterium]|nr:hypothetical protein [Alphaproteobacteria bacterium]